jgi:hypothetical protein
MKSQTHVCSSLLPEASIVLEAALGVLSAIDCAVLEEIMRHHPFAAACVSKQFRTSHKK